MNLDNILSNFMIETGVNATLAKFLAEGLIFIAFILLALLFNYLTKNVLTNFIIRITKRTTYTFDDLLVQRDVIKYLVQTLPAIIIIILLPIFFDEGRHMTSLFRKICVIYILFCLIMTANGFILTLYDKYRQKKEHRQRSIRGFVQVVQVILFFVGFIIMVSIIINRSPAALFAGLGASAAILSLVFKDLLTGFVAGVQLSLNDMVRPGDWITLPDNKTDGIVQEITLITVKIKNFDNSIATVPPTVLVTNTFKNWREMLESNGRLVMKSVYVDKASVKFATPEMLQKYKSTYPILSDYQPTDKDQPTNTGVFRAYMEQYLLQRPDINPDMGLKIGELESIDRGLPIQLFFFSRNKEDKAFEKIQSDVFDHAMAVLPSFDLVIK